MRIPSCNLPHSRGTAVRTQPGHLHTIFAFLLTFSGLALLSQAAHAQPALRLSRLSMDALPDLKVYLTYVAPDGPVISGRTAANFNLLIDAAEQGPANALTLFEKVNEPIFVVTIAQVAGAVREPILTEVKAGFRKLSQTVSTNPASRMGVLAYSGSTRRLLEAGNATEVEGALAKLAVDAAGAEIHLLDALRTAMDMLKAQPQGQRKLIVVVSDGTDVGSDKRGFIDIGNRAQLAGIVINTIGINELDPAKLRNLQEMSRRCYGTSRVAKSAAEVSAQLTAVAEEIQKQYVATFRLSIAGDDKEHVFQVVENSSNKPVYSNAFLTKLPASGNKPASGGAKLPQGPVKTVIVPAT